MIEPYETAVRPIIDRLLALGFGIDRERDYFIKCSGHGYFLNFNAERNFPPSLNVTFTDQSGKEFNIGMLAEVIDPSWYEVTKGDVNSMRARIIDELRQNPDEPATMADVIKYLRYFAAALVEFVLKHESELISPTTEIRSAYEAKEGALLSSIGVRREEATPSNRK